jgi:hypothetical protein
MALSDVLADAAVNLVEGAEWYDDYREEDREWVRNTARLLAVAAGAVQDHREPFPVLPTISLDAESAFVGPQLCHPCWPLGAAVPA